MNRPARPFFFLDDERKPRLKELPDGVSLRPLHDHRVDAALFDPDPDLVVAVNVARAVRQPLLLTGEPGTGKTQVAYWIADMLGVLDDGEPDPNADDADPRRRKEASPYMLPVKSSTSATDLLYSFDTVRYFHASQDEERRRKGTPLDPREFRTRGPLWRAFDDANCDRHAVVLVDEIDKAPRDVPNDMLHELDQYDFRVRETRESVSLARDAPPPFVIITSNNERRLPDAFLRRCVFHHMRLSRSDVERIVERHREATGNLAEDVRRDAVEVFMALRSRKGLRKAPATSELLAWLRALELEMAHAPGPTRERVRAAARDGKLGALPAAGTLIKDSEDLKALARA